MAHRAVIYARVSSQAQKDRHTIASQLEVLPEYVHRQGWQLVRPADTYVDDGRTAKAGHLEKRPGLKRLLVDAAAGEFDIVAVVDFDRLTRAENWTERGFIIGALQNASVRIAEYSTGQLHDPDDSQGDLMIGMRAYFAAEENRKRRERTLRGKATAISKGRKPSGPTPFGLRYDRASGAFSIAEDEAKIICEIFSRVAAGEPCTRLEYDLNVRQIPTAAADRRNRAAEWRRERIYNLVTSTTYRGEWVVDRKRRISIKVPRIVEDLVWYRAQEQLKSWQRRGLRRTKHVYLCEEIAVCAECEARIGISTHGYSTATGRVRHGYYTCSHRRRPPFGEARCQLPMRRVDEVDERLWSAVHDLLTARWGELRELISARQRRAEAAVSDWAADLAGYRGKLERLGKTEQVVLAQYRRGLVTESALEQELETIARERSFLLQQIDTAQRAMAGARTEPVLLDAVDHLRRALRRATPATRRDIVRAIIPGRDGYNVRLGAHSIEARVAFTPRVALVRSSGSKPHHESNHENLLVVVELVA